MPKQKYEVTLPPTPGVSTARTVDVTADACRALSSGCLAFLDSNGGEIVVYGPTGWLSYRPIREASALKS